MNAKQINEDIVRIIADVTEDHPNQFSTGDLKMRVKRYLYGLSLDDQQDFDTTIGQLDRVLSKMIGWSESEHVDDANKQTLKHHAEDMVGAGNKILKTLGESAPAPPTLEQIDREFSEEIMQFVRDFYPNADARTRMDHFLAEVEELKEADQSDRLADFSLEAADCALILFHMILAAGGMPLETMRHKLRLARQRIESGEKSPRPSAQPPAPGSEGTDDPMACECATWGTDAFIAGHHYRCEKFNPKPFIDCVARLVVGMERWASDEDGVHGDAWQAYCEGCRLLNREVKCESDATESASPAGGETVEWPTYHGLWMHGQELWFATDEGCGGMCITSERFKKLHDRSSDAKAAGLIGGWRPVSVPADGELSRESDEVNHWRVKAQCYGNIVHGCSPALEAAGFPVDSSTSDGAVGGIKRAVEALAANRDFIRDENARLAADLEAVTKERHELRMKLAAADAMAYAVDAMVHRKALNARSQASDARLQYGDPFTYEHVNADLAAQWNANIEAQQPCGLQSEEVAALTADRDRLAAELAEAKAELANTRQDAGELILSTKKNAVENYLAFEEHAARVTAERDAALAECERLRKACESVMANGYYDDNVIERHSSTTVSCESLRMVRDALAPPAGSVERAETERPRKEGE